MSLNEKIATEEADLISASKTYLRVILSYFSYYSVKIYRIIHGCVQMSQGFI